jgi:hypothetical protein
LRVDLSIEEMEIGAVDERDGRVSETGMVKMKKVPIRSMFPTGPVKNGLYIRIKKVSLQSKSN